MTKPFHCTPMRAVRMLSGVSLAELANKVGCSAGHLSNAERGYAVLTDDLLKKIAEALGVSAKCLI